MKQHIGKNGILPVIPVTIIATEVDGKKNFAPHGQCGTVSAEPSVIYTSVIKTHKTAQNILKAQRFSVNIPGSTLLEQVKHCGSVSGNDMDKSSCFEVFHGSERVPMIKDCPISFVCKVVETVEINGFLVFFGEVLETWVDSECLTDGIPDAKIVKPLLCNIDGSFRAQGEKLGEMKNV